MWLLSTTSRELRQFVASIPYYVILSHTWGEGEVTFDDISKPHAKSMAGYNKIWQCCEQAIRDGFEWAWIDTCCIDKRSSAELSEAINSMYRWYWEAAVCYAYLADVRGDAELAQRAEPGWENEFKSSRWFRRGWTLQELLAPDVVEFYDLDWNVIGTKSSLLGLIQSATQIDKPYISNRELIEHASIAAKFSWASCRQTTRVEDMAYCLLGLVQVNMPMLYGEGEKAFYRLQLEIIKQTNEHTIFAWETNSTQEWHRTSMFAHSPALFATAAQIRPIESHHQATLLDSGSFATHEVTNNGLSITLPFISVDQNRVVAILSCADRGEGRVGVWMERVGNERYQRVPGSRVTISEDEVNEASPMSIYIAVDKGFQGQAKHRICSMRIVDLPMVLSPWLPAGIAVGTRSAIKLIRTAEEWTINPASDEVSGLVNCLVLRDGEFACIRLYSIDTAKTYRFNIALGLHQSRSWLRILDVNRETPAYNDTFGHQVQMIHEEFGMDSQADSICSNMSSNFCDYVRVQFRHEGRISASTHTLVVKAKKTLSQGLLEWKISIVTLESACEPEPPKETLKPGESELMLG